MKNEYADVPDKSVGKNREHTPKRAKCFLAETRARAGAFGPEIFI